MKKLGKIIIYYGKGEGKTSAALGRAIRMAGYGKRVIILHFMKRRKTSEYKFFQKIKTKKLQIAVHLCGFPEFLTKKNYLQHQKRTQQALALAKEIIKDRSCDLLVLDEILYTLKFKLLKEKDVLNLLKNRGKIHIILTGNFLSKKLREFSDQISKISKIKHYFDKGQKTIKGLEY